jgi:hypothetical protein
MKSLKEKKKPTRNGSPVAAGIMSRRFSVALLQILI